MSAMATDGATLDCFLNKLMALPTVCPRKSWGHADGSSGSPFKFPQRGRGGQKEFATPLSSCQHGNRHVLQKSKKGFVRECCLATRGVANAV